MKTVPISIFNDVLGPVMRGPSSSHTAASVRIASLARMLLEKELRQAKFYFSNDGSLATTHESQGTDIGLAAGLAGIEISSQNLLNSLEIAQTKGIEIIFEVTDFPNNHPNTYKICLTDINGDKLKMTALSTGGGMLLVTEIDSFPVEMYGDCWEAFYYLHTNDDEALGLVNSLFDSMPLYDKPFGSHVSLFEGRALLNLKFAREPKSDLLQEISCLLNDAAYRFASPVLPILRSIECKCLFSTATEIEKLFNTDEKQLWEIGLEYEAVRGSISKEAVWEQAAYIHDTMRQSVNTGVAGTEYNDRILGHQSYLLEKNKRRILDTPLFNMVSKYVMAVMETKSSFGTIVAAPTAGSCGAIPGAILGCVDVLGLSREDGIKAILAAGTIGILIAARSTFSAEVAGCQAECGSASGMAAAAIVQLTGGNASEAIDAASFALQNIFGMTCDPVAGRVEVPCLGKNILAATNAIVAANLTVAGMNTVIPLDETIEAMDKVGRSLPFELRCTGLGGLSVTPTSKKIEEEMRK